MKKVFSIAITAVALCAMAQDGLIPVASAHGRGVAKSADNRVGEFNFEGVKLKKRDGTFVYRGPLEFTQVRNANGPMVKISSRSARIVGVNEHVAEIGYPAVMVLPPLTAGGQPRRVEGRAAVRVVDNRPGNATEGPRDVFGIHFTKEGTDINFNFVGEVQRGDIGVRVAQP